jgi:hypothetical protein
VWSPNLLFEEIRGRAPNLLYEEIRGGAPNLLYEEIRGCRNSFSEGHSRGEDRTGRQRAVDAGTYADRGREGGVAATTSVEVPA